MTEHSQNGWTASQRLPLRPFVVNGTAFPPGIRDDDDVETVLRHVVEQYDYLVEPLRSPGCWGWSYRANRNDPNSLSNHASGTAVDVNAPAHPNGVPTARTFSDAQVRIVHAILAEVDGAVRWGGDYTHTPDSMHFEVNTDAAHLHEVAEKLRDDMPSPKDWTKEDWAAFNKNAAPVIAEAVVDFPVSKNLTPPVGLGQAVNQIRNAAEKAKK